MRIETPDAIHRRVWQLPAPYQNSSLRFGPPWDLWLETPEVHVDKFPKPRSWELWDAFPPVASYLRKRHVILDDRLDLPDPEMATVSPADVKNGGHLDFDNTDVIALI